MIVSLLLPHPAIAGEPSDPYLLPLIPPYVVSKLSPTKVRLIARSSEASSYGGQILVEDVREVGTAKSFIVGRTATSFFLLDTAAGEPKPQLFRSEAEWSVALKALHLGDPVTLSDPDTLVAHMPDPIVRPWNYDVMKNSLGLSDSAWSLLTQATGLVVAFAWGLLRRPGRTGLMAQAVVIGWVTAFVALMLLAGEGPGLAIGLIVFPVLSAIAIASGRGLRRLLVRGVPPSRNS